MCWNVLGLAYLLVCCENDTKYASLYSELQQLTQQPALFLISFHQSRFVINDKQQYTTEKVSQTDADVSMQEVVSPLCLKVEGQSVEVGVGAGCG